MARLGYGYEDFNAVNPRIIYCSGSGYGEDGPYVSRPGQDMLIQSLTGIMAATGQADNPPPPEMVLLLRTGPFQATLPARILHRCLNVPSIQGRR